MKAQNSTDAKKPIEGQDFNNPEETEHPKPSSHGEVANQVHGDFSDLEETRMEHPPKHRYENGSEKEDTDDTKGVGQSSGINQ